MLPALVSAAGSFVLVAALVPLVARLLRESPNLVARPVPDRWHQLPVLKAGGVAMCVALVPLIFLLPSQTLLHRVLLLAFAMGAIGFIDDVMPAGPWTKLAAQTAAAGLFLSSGPIPAIVASPSIDLLCSVGWILLLTNAFNLIDNIDGLAAGVAAIAATGAVTVLAFAGGADPGVTIGLAAIAGIACAFLLYNWHPASIFMGDCGSHLLGSSIAGATLLAWPHAAPGPRLSTAILLLVVPIADTLLVSITRVAAGISPFTGGRDHISHRLVAIGFGERGAVLSLYGVAICGALTALACEYSAAMWAWAAAAFVVAATATITILLGRVRIERHSAMLPAATGIHDTSRQVPHGATMPASTPSRRVRPNPVL